MLRLGEHLELPRHVRMLFAKKQLRNGSLLLEKPHSRIHSTETYGFSS